MVKSCSGLEESIALLGTSFCTPMISFGQFVGLVSG